MFCVCKLMKCENSLCTLKIMTKISEMAEVKLVADNHHIMTYNIQIHDTLYTDKSNSKVHMN